MFYGSLISKSEYLELPHPRAHERLFVLKPLTNIAPHFLHPILNNTIENLQIPNNLGTIDLTENYTSGPSIEINKIPIPSSVQHGGNFITSIFGKRQLNHTF